MFIDGRYVNPDHITNITYSFYEREDEAKQVFKVNKFRYHIVNGDEIEYTLINKDGIFSREYGGETIDVNSKELERLYPDLEYKEYELKAHLTLSCGTKFDVILESYSYYSKINENQSTYLSKYLQRDLEISVQENGVKFDMTNINIEKATQMVMNLGGESLKKEKKMI